jgi:hypothetical protein
MCEMMVFEFHKKIDQQLCNKKKGAGMQPSKTSAISYLFSHRLRQNENQGNYMINVLLRKHLRLIRETQLIESYDLLHQTQNVVVHCIRKSVLEDRSDMECEMLDSSVDYYKKETDMEQLVKMFETMKEQHRIEYERDMKDQLQIRKDLLEQLNEIDSGFSKEISEWDAPKQGMAAKGTKGRKRKQQETHLSILKVGNNLYRVIG